MWLVCDGLTVCCLSCGKLQAMKKLFFSSSGGDPRAQSTFVGKSLNVGSYHCTVEEVIAEGNELCAYNRISHFRPTRYHLLKNYVKDYELNYL